ncbi:CD93 molecule S homeolog precursor [Xenopus laevis]|uniref:CD93 molecule S homeolog precursor n=2 Tax=Xenopus laevis TaxID=8355 RepID=A0A8J0Q1S1_XENLA|nr:CD93 molecule S homeolog precursor [Xenopus laevis]
MACAPFLLFISVFSLAFMHGGHGSVQNEVLCVSKACYTVHLEKNSFANAKEKCITNGGNLITIKNQEEANHVNSLLSKLTSGAPDHGPLKLWIGLQLKSCTTDLNLLKGFAWVTGQEDTDKSQFSNWKQKPKGTCTSTRCVTMALNPSLPDNYKWSDGKCSGQADGYLCEFHFIGMCKRLAMAGPGVVHYHTPFDIVSSSLELVPHGSMALVTCQQGLLQDANLICRQLDNVENVFYWNQSPAGSRSPEPMCASPNIGCKYNNGGCEQECIEDSSETGSIRCACKGGYVLASDSLSCVLSQHCQPNPCDYQCINQLNGFQCSCPEGFVLHVNKVNCTDVDECLAQPCNQSCANTLGSFQCSCQKGFKAQGEKCIDIDECIDSPCAQDCLNTHGSYHCSCKEGYVNGGDRISCVDVDECISSPCEVLCHNIPGGYTCSCLKGFHLASNGISCSPDLQSENPTDNDTDGGVIVSSVPKGEPRPTQSPLPSDSLTDFPGISGSNDTNDGTAVTSVSLEVGHSSDNSSVDHIKSSTMGEQRLIILVSTVCACGALLVLAVIAGVYYYRNKQSQKTKYEAPIAPDNDSWAPEQSQYKAVSNQYR